MAQTDPYASIAQPIPQVRTGAVGGPAGVYPSQGVSNPPNGGQVTDVNNPEPNDPYAALAQPQDGSAPSVGVEKPYSDQLLAAAPSFLKGIGIGAARGAGQTTNAIGHLLYPDWAAKHLTGAPSPKQQEGYFAPKNTTQAIGKGIEQAGEFLLPGLGEDAATADAGRLLPRLQPLVRVGYNALTSGAVNKLQGGNFGTGAAAGGAAGAVGEGLRAVAPHLAESALNIRKLDRAYGKGGGKIGRTILDETSGFTPGRVAESAQSRLDELNPRLDAAAAAARGASLSPAQDVLLNAGIKAERQGERTTLGQLEPMMTHLSEDIQGNPLPETVPAPRLLDLKRGFGNEFIHRWNPETMEGVKGTAAKTYHALGEEFNNTVPEARELNGRISKLIPIAKRAESVELNAPTAQRMAHRWGAHTGAAASGLFGGYEGYRKGGARGALAGLFLGSAVPEVIASPTGEMVAARLFNRSAPLMRAGTGTALQLTSKSKDTDKDKR